MREVISSTTSHGCRTISGMSNLRACCPSMIALVLLVPAPTIGTAMAMTIAPGPVGQTIFVVTKAWLLVFPAAWFVIVEKGSPSLSKPTRGGLGVATILGLAITACIFTAYWTVGRHWIDREHVRTIARQNGVGSLPVYLTMAVYWITINSLLEEYVWRWFVVRKCQDIMASQTAILCSAAFFTVHHVVALRIQFDWRVTILAALGVFIGGVVWSWLYVRFRSIWPCYISHAIADIPIFVLGYLLILT